MDYSSLLTVLLTHIPFVLTLFLAVQSDLRTFRIPNVITLGGFFLLLLIPMMRTGRLPVAFLTDSAFAFSLMAVISLTTGGRLGMGDAKLSLSVGGVLGAYYWLISLFLASVSALAFIGIGLRANRIRANRPIPFAPFLALGALVSLIFKMESLLEPF